jgi:glycosyltransferase involved in cell wall biosynthesis
MRPDRNLEMKERSAKGILLLVDSLGSGGAQRQLVNLAIGLKSRGHRVTVLVYHSADFYAHLLREANVELVREIKTSRYSLGIIPRLRRHVLDPRHDIVLSFMDTPNFYAEICGIGQRRTKIVVSERFCASDTRRWWALRQLHRCADWVTTNSHHLRTDLEARFPFVRGRTTTIYNGVDMQVFSPPPSRRTAKGRPLELLVVSSVSEYKNGLRLIDALHRLREHHGLQPVLRWVGAHDLRNPGRRRMSQQMHDRIEELGLGEQWCWLGERQNVADLMREHDALVHPSFQEGLPNAICEALACGLPVLASRTLDHPRLVQEGVSGLLFDWQDADDMARAIARFAQMDDARRHEMGAAARAYAERELSMSHLLDSYEQLLEKLLGGRSN